MPDQVKLVKCPGCRKRVPLSHFSCTFGAKGGRKIAGRKKVRGDSSYYSFLGRCGAKKRHGGKAS